MAEALGLTSSIVALVQLSASVYSATSKFYREAKEAKSTIGALATQTRNLSGVLQNLSLLASSPLLDDVEVSVPDFRDTYIEACRNTLHKIKRKIEKAESDFESGSRRRLVTRSLKWPFVSQETINLTAELSQHRDNLQLALSADTMSHLLRCLVNTNSIAASVDALARKIDRKESIDQRAEVTEKREKIIKFFQKVNPEAYFQDCRNRREANTGKWLIQRDPTFLDWIHSSGSEIWLSGIPGAGKTILCGTIVDEVLQEQDPSTAVAFFFCDYKSAESQDPLNILASLAVQLARQSDAAFEILESYHEELHPHNRIGKLPETKRMIEIVQAMISHYDLVYLVVDGLDECGSNVVEALQSIKQLTRGDRVNLALFSRNEPDIIEELSDCPRIEIAAHTEDLELYVLAQMESRRRLGALAVRNPELHKHIIRTLIEGANGMFRWVACQLDHLDGLPSDRRRRKALTELPPTLFETYDRILDGILKQDEQDQELCQKALHWIGLGYQNLSPLALCEAISIPDDQDLIDKELLVEPEWISRRCSSLIRLAGEESDEHHFQFAHFSVKEYLRSIKPQSTRSLFRFSEDVAGQCLMRTSLRFLTFPIFDRRPMIALSEIHRMAERNDQHPFYPFAAVNISRSSSTGWEDEVSKQLSSLLEDEAMMCYARTLFHPDKTGIFMSWVLQAIWSQWEDDSDEDTFCSFIGLLLAPEFTSLHIAAMLALPSVCTHLIDSSKVDPNVCCRIGTPLHALLAGVSLLYYINDFNYDPELHFRISSGPECVAYDQPRICLEILLENGADTSLRWKTTSIFEMAMNNSVQRSYDKAWIYPLINPSTIVPDECIEDFRKQLFSGDIDQSLLDAIMRLSSASDITPEWARLVSLVQTWAMESKQASEGAMSSLALQARISDEDFADSIRISLGQNLTDTLPALLQDSRFSPEMHITDDYYHDSLPFLHLAIESGNLKSVELLLNAGCDAKVVDESDGWTSLHQCAISDTEDAHITTLLIESGVDISAKNCVGRTCWHVGARNGNIKFLKVLIARDCDSKRSLATTSDEGRTPLASAVLEGEIDSALLLLDQCHGEPEFFESDRSLLDEAVAIGSEVLFMRLHEKLKEAKATEAIQSSRPFDHISMLCSPKLFDYILSSWVLDRTTASNTLVQYLLDTDRPSFNDPDEYPTRYYMDHVVRGLLPPGYFFGDDDKIRTHSWELFCEKVVPYFTITCNHQWSQCRTGLISMIFGILIADGVLASYEREFHLPGYRPLFRALLNRHDQLRCSWIDSSVRKVLEATSLPGDLPGDAVSIEILSHAVESSSIELVRELLDRGVDIHAAQGRLSPLEQACYSSSLPMFHLVSGRSDRTFINRTGSKGKTLLHWVVSGKVSGCAEKIEHLIQLGAHIDSETDDPSADTALTLASRAFREDIVALLVARGADPLHRGRDGWTVLHAASIRGDFRYVQHLIHLDVPDAFWLSGFPMRMSVWNTTVKKSTAIHFAACNGKAHFLARLIENQVLLDANAVTEYPRFTPLHFASWFGHLEVVEILISSNADVNLKDAFGRRPIDIAANGKHSDIVKTLMESGSEKPLSQFVADGTGDSDLTPRMAFETAIVKGNVELCRILAERGHSVNARLASCSCRPIVRAIIEQQTAIVDWLVSVGVGLTGLSYDGHPSLRCIASLGTHHISSTKSICGLLELALSQNVGWYGSLLGPLHVAILDNKMEALDAILTHIRMNNHAYRKLIDTEAIKSAANTTWDGRSALSILVNEFNHEDAFSGDSPWDKDFTTGSPLHWAVRENNVRAVEMLLRNGAALNQVDSSGSTPLLLAARDPSSPKILRELLNAGAGPAGRLDAMLEATRKGDLDVIRMLAEYDPETVAVADRFSADGLIYHAGSVEVMQYLLSQGLSPFTHQPALFSSITICTTSSRFTGFIFNSGLLSQTKEALISEAFAFAVDNDQFPVIRRLHRILPKDLYCSLLNSTRPGWASPLCVAASRNAAQRAEDLVHMGAKVEMEGSPYGSPLMVACSLGSLDVVKYLVRAGAALLYVNEDGLLRSAVASSFPHQEVKRWLLVERHIEQRKLGYQSSPSKSHESPWSGPRIFKLALPSYMLRDDDESRWDHLKRLQEWKKELMGSTLAESRLNSGLDLNAGYEDEAKRDDAETARRRFMARLGDD